MSDKFSGVKEVRCIKDDSEAGFMVGDVYTLEAVLYTTINIKIGGMVYCVKKEYFEPVLPEPTVVVSLPTISYQYIRNTRTLTLPSLEIYFEGYLYEGTLLDDLRESLEETIQNSIKKETLRRSKQKELKRLQKEVDKAKSKWDDTILKLHEARENT